ASSPLNLSTRQLLNLNETAESEDSALSRGGRSMRPAGSLHALDKAEGGQAFSNDRAKQSRHDYPSERDRDRVRRSRFPQGEECEISRLPEISEAFRRPAHRWHR